MQNSRMAPSSIIVDSIALGPTKNLLTNTHVCETAQEFRPIILTIYRVYYSFIEYKFSLLESKGKNELMASMR